ncbi:hypothetical protein [Desulfococcus sp.]|uniref:hypothetical protein n=1 Tax=Desulfococcus sp. TaxID=2025834 RepID=UPI0035943182
MATRHLNPPKSSEGHEMGEKNGSCQEGSTLDIPHLIRSIQRIEGGRACFGKPGAECDPASCRWQDLCARMHPQAFPGPPEGPSKKRK